MCQTAALSIQLGLKIRSLSLYLSASGLHGNTLVMQSFELLSPLIDRSINVSKDKMYNTTDYLRNGVLYLNNILRPRHKKLSTLMIYSTTKCQSRCKHCSIWQKPEEHLSLHDIQQIMASRCITKKHCCRIGRRRVYSPP